jgi:hypothetical protein
VEDGQDGQRHCGFVTCFCRWVWNG